MNFSYYSSLYLDFKKHELKNSTLDKYTNIVKNRIDPIFKNRDINDIKPSDVKKWLYSIYDVGSKSKRHYLGVLSGIFQEALFDEVIQRNPVKFVKLPKYEKPDIKPFNADEVQKIMNNVDDNNFKYYLAIAFYTGMRSGEIIGLKKEDIDLKNKTIHVKRSRSRHGESTPKTKGSIREIPIIQLLDPFIHDLYNLHDNEYLFITQYKKPYRDTNVFVNKFWIPSLNDLNIEYRRPYNTRHTYATNMLYNDLVSPVQLAQLLGHANTQMVYEVYVSYIQSNYKDFDRSMSIYK
ncbi:site-specific integrase [Sulfurimonas crateris]|uniref:Site-specific integrase n=1 Tax=Sulfurimonas crateris TaxID=2574727 RepID=A0A4U2Z5L5_9BACT|nr:site-specific integrase [Sulfurimonas crateris]